MILSFPDGKPDTRGYSPVLELGIVRNDTWELRLHGMLIDEGVTAAEFKAFTDTILAEAVKLLDIATARLLEA